MREHPVKDALVLKRDGVDAAFAQGMQRVFPNSNDRATADELPQAPVDRCQDILVAEVAHAHVAEDRDNRARRGKAGHKPPLGKLLAHALEGRKQRPIKEGALRIDGKAAALERGIADR